MAGGRRDVDLVIRAEDKASKLLENITTIINKFTGEAADADSTVSKLGTGFSKFGTAIKTLDNALKGMSGVDYLRKNFDEAGTAVDRLGTKLDETNKDVSRFEQGVVQAAMDAQKFTKELNANTAALDREKQKLREASENHKKLSQDIRAATGERDRLVAADERLTATIAKQEARLTGAQQKVARYAEQIASTERPTRRMQSNLDAANASVDRHATRLDELRKSQTDGAARAQQLGTSIKEMATAIDASSAKIVEQKTNIATLDKALTDAKSSASAAEKSQRDFTRSLDRSKQAVQSQAAALERAQSSQREMAQTISQAETAMSQLAAEARGPLQEAFRQQQSTVSRINNAYQANRTELAQLSQAMSAVGVPTREMVEAYNRLNAVSREIQTAHKQETAVLRAMGTELKSTAADTAQLAAVTRQFQQNTTNSAAVLQRVSSSASQAAAQTKRLADEQARAARNARDVGARTRESGQAAAGAAGSVSRLSQAYRKLYGESRLAMSWTQRLRGEVISMIAAYSGLQGVISLLSQTVTAYQTLEAAQSRLGALFEGDNEKVGQELDFIRRNANRLGIEFGALADEYTKFAASTKNTNLEGAETRRIFISVAEAARVNKLSFEDLQGVFRALTQISSKGKVQLEELTGQLGDRLPGALQIMADGLGVTTEELLAMTKEGEVSRDALIGFADELTRRYGPQLAASLLSTTTALGQLQNAAFQALLAFGQAGFLEGFTQLVRDLTETLNDPAFQSFAAKISVAMGALAKAIGFAAKNFDILVIAASAFIGIKLAPILLSLGSSFLALATGSSRTGKIIQATGGMIAGTTGVVGRATTAFRGLTLAMRALLSTTGAGLVITAIATGIGYWVTRAEEATTALSAHQVIVDQVKDAYDRVGGSVDEWRKKVNDLTQVEAERNLMRLRDALEEVRKEAADAGDWGISKLAARGVFDSAIGAQADQLAALKGEFREGRISGEAYRTMLDQIARSAKDSGVRETATQMLEASRATDELAKRVAEAEKIVKAKTGTDEEAKEALDELNGAQGKTNEKLEDAAEATEKARKNMELYKEGLEDLKGMLPQFADELEKLKAAMDLSEAVGKLGFNNITPEVLGWIKQVQGQNSLGKNTLGSLTNATDATDATMTILRRFEGFISSPKWDVNAYRAGYGSDTVTLDDGSIQKVVQGMTVTRAQAENDLMRRVTTEFLPKAISQVGEARFNQFTPAQQGVLGSIAYNYGELPARILEAVRTGTNAEIGTAIRGLREDNGGINRGRRDSEASIFEGGVGEAETAERTAKAVKDKAEDAKEFHETQKASNEQASFELSIADQELVKREQAKAIREAELAAQKAGTTLQAEEREQILANVEAKYREQQAEERIADVKKKAAEADAKVNALMDQRAALLERMELYKESGDTANYDQTKTALAEVEKQLVTAREEAIKMWQAVEGPESAAAIENLRTAAVEAQNLANAGQQSFLNWSQVGELFVDRLVGAFDEFAQAVANGENVWDAARTAFLRFAADFLIEIGKMILKQALFNLVRGLGGPFASVGVAHSGAVVGRSSGRTRNVNPGIFATAGRMHGGGLVGLKANEVPMILEEGEEVLSKDSPRNILNAGGKGGATPAPAPAARGVRIVNAFDTGDVVSQGLASAAGEDSFINVVRARRSEIKEILG